MSEFMKAGKFKAECLKVMGRVRRTRRRVVITKRNVPVAQMVPIEKKVKNSTGNMKGTVHFKGDIYQPIGEDNGMP